MARGALVAAGLVLIIGGGAAVGYAVTRKSEGGMSPTATAAMTAAVNQLDGDIKAARAGAVERAATLSAIQQVRAAVATDADTAKDMVARGELAFNPPAGEVVELGQVKPGAPPVTLIIQPDGGVHSSHAGKPGSYSELMGTQLVITEVVDVKAVAGTDAIGYLMVSRPLDLAKPIADLAKAGVAGHFDLGGQTLAIGPSLPVGAITNTVSLPSQPDAHLVVASAVITSAMPFPILAAGATGAGIGLVLLAIGLMKRTPAQTAVVGAPLTGQLIAVEAGTRPSSSQIATGTPSLTDTPGMSLSASLSTPHNLGAGAMIGRWEVIKRLGSGGMADVFLARARGDAGFEKLVALKVMHAHLARNQRAVDHFLDEARLAARVVHPNVVAIQDLGKIGADYVIVMEYVDGVDLERLLAGARAGGRLVPLAVGLGILGRICDGLNAAHTATAPDGTRLNIVHRDVKAANVLISRQGGVKVVDFGIAKAATQSHMTIAGETKGTPSMMAPEQRVGEQVDVRADVYSVAAVGFEVLTGNGVNLDLAALAHLGVDNWPHLPPPSSLRGDLPRELDQILLTAMAFDREKRPADCAVFEQAFETVAKRYNFAATDKDIARWVESELTQLPVERAEGHATPVRTA